MAYMILISGWATLFLESWSRQQNTLAHMWGVLHSGTEDVVRSEFEGERRYSHWLGELDSSETKVRVRVAYARARACLRACVCAIRQLTAVYTCRLRTGSAPSPCPFCCSPLRVSSLSRS